MGGILKAFGITYLLIAVLMGVVFLGRGQWREWLALMQVFLYVIGGLLVFSLLIMLVLFRNRMDARFVLDRRKAFCEMRSASLQRAVPYARWLGLLIGKPRLGGKLRQAAYQGMEADWPLVAEARYDERRCQIVLRNRWRNLLVLYCPPPRYAEIAAFVQARLAAAHPPGEVRQASPLPRALWRSALIVLACMGLFALPYPFEQDIFMLIFLLCFGIATVWIVSLLGYAVLFGVLWSVGEILHTGLRFREASLVFADMPRRYRGFDSLYGDEWLQLAVCLAGLAYLAWDAWRAVRGKNPSVMEGDYGG
jgi:hypothetical protein